MPKKTIQQVLADRRADPRALQGAITFYRGQPRIVFGVVGEHKRFTLAVDGNDFVLVDDPRGLDVARSAPERPQEAKVAAGAGDAAPEQEAAPESAPERPKGKSKK